jgi:hypothetical protein
MSLGCQFCSAARLSCLRAGTTAGAALARALRPFIALSWLLLPACWLLLPEGSASAQFLDAPLEALDLVTVEPMFTAEPVVDDEPLADEPVVAAKPVVGTLPGAGTLPAPMCDPDAASVAAQDEIPEIDRGRFESLPCEAQLLLSRWQPDVPEVGRRAVRCGDVDPSAPAQHADTARPHPEGAGQAGDPFPARLEPSLTVFGARAGLRASCGVEPVPFRPPLTRSR